MGDEVNHRPLMPNLWRDDYADLLRYARLLSCCIYRITELSNMYNIKQLEIADILKNNMANITLHKKT
jgi:hypothetical protein